MAALTARNGDLPKRKSALRLAMAADGRLTRSALALGMVILEHIFAEDGYCGETIGQLRIETGAGGDRMVQYALADLIRFGYFVSRSGGGRGQPNRIFIADEADRKGATDCTLSADKGCNTATERVQWAPW